MKDAKGHGSDARGGGVSEATKAAQQFQASRLTHGPHFLEPNDPRGAHSAGIQQVGKPVAMQRRQYEAIAGAISRSNTDQDTKGALAQHFANALVGTNPHFDGNKFQTAAMTGNMGKTKGADPGMQSRHYEAVAGALATFNPAARGSTTTRSQLAAHFASDLGSRNSNFNSQRFIKAAGG